MSLMHRYREFTYSSKDGLRLFCREYAPDSPARTVLCLPGLTRNSRDFEPLARHLARNFRVLTPDLRGRGRSQWDSDATHYHAAIYHQDVLQLLKARGKVSLWNTVEGYRATLTWNAQHFPSLMFWFSNYGRKAPPWSGRSIPGAD